MCMYVGTYKLCCSGITSLARVILSSYATMHEPDHLRVIIFIASVKSCNMCIILCLFIFKNIFQCSMYSLSYLVYRCYSNNSLEDECVITLNILP